METKVSTFGATPDPTQNKSGPATRPETPTPATRPSNAPNPIDLRLVIEEDKATGSYIYKTVNRVTGEVILQLPREQLVRMQEQLEYVAGTVIRARA